MTKVDVIIPAYNAHEYIKDVLKSLEKQTIRDKLAITIIDDGSEKKYDEIISSFPNLNIKIIRLRRNRGAYYAKQVGIDKTCNPYITFLDSDDVLVGVKALEKMLKKLEEDDNYKIVMGKEYVRGNTEYNESHMVAKILKREVIDKYKIRILKLKMEEDVSFMLSYYAMIGEKEMAKITDIVYSYRLVNKNSVTKSCREIYTYGDLFKAIDHAYKLVKKYKRYDYFKKRMYEMYLALAKIYELKYKNNVFLREDFLRNCQKFIKKYNKYLGEIPVSGLTKYDDLQYDLACRFWNVLQF